MNSEQLMNRRKRLGARWLLCGLAILGVARAQGTAVTETVLHNFPENAPKGSFPEAGLVADPAGNLYGTANQGGASRWGVIFKVDPSGRTTVLHSFTNGADGGSPEATLFRDPAGNLYGTAGGGGDPSCLCGVVFKLDPKGSYKVLHTFTGGPDGGNPHAGVILDDAGNLYGTTYIGGNTSCFQGCGVVYKVDPAGNETPLYSFTGGADGANPEAGVIRDSDGNLYGTTFQGGTGCGGGCGVVYKVDPSGAENVLYNFTGGADGELPQAGVIRDSAGNLFGTTIQGGSNFAGVVYKLDPNGNETVLHTFTGGPDGGGPLGLIRDSAGNFYGATDFGGASGAGVVYKLDIHGNETVLYNFTGESDGGNPQGGVIRDSNGNLYGTTNHGGAANQGAVYKLDTSNHETVLCNFPSPPDGGGPLGGVIGSGGYLYGATYYGGTMDLGTVFKVDAAGHETVLHQFTGGSDGSAPLGDLTADPAGNIYGATVNGGPSFNGTIYKVDPSGNETVFFSFPGFFPWTGGFLPFDGPIRDSAGNLYGTTYLGGGTSGCCGVVYKLDPTGTQETVLYTFTGGSDGNSPFAGVTRDSKGNLYGTTPTGGAAGLGVVYKLGPEGHQKVLHSFLGGSDGANPYARVVLDPDGNIYGTTAGGGTGNAGVVFKLDPAGNEILLHTFTGGAGGSGPNRLYRDPDGTLYGTTNIGGDPANAGVVFKLVGTDFTVLYAFQNGDDGGQPNAGVIRDTNGNFYGTTSLGGNKHGGTVFKLTP